MYPRVMWLAGDFDGPVPEWKLKQLAMGQAAILDWDDRTRPWGLNGQSVGETLREMNPEIMLISYIRGSFWPDQRDMSRERAPFRNGVLDLLQAEEMWSHRDNGERIRPFRTGEALLSPAGVDALAGYVAEHWDASYWGAAHIDGMLAEWWHLTAPRAVSEALVPAMQRLATTLEASSIPVQGNGSWSPSTAGIDTKSPYLGLIRGCFVEKFPTYEWYDLAGNRGPDASMRWRWHMDLAEEWLGTGATLHTLHTDRLHESGYFGNWVKGPQQGARFTLASSLLLGCWFTPPEGLTPFACDEMFVTNGATSWDAAGRGWLGYPLGKMFQAGPAGVWVRVFERGAAIVNAMTAPATVRLEPGVYRRISGMFDAANDGQWVTDLTVPAMDAAVLWRPDPHPSPLPGGEGEDPHPGPLPGGEGSGEGMEELRRRVERIEMGLAALFEVMRQ